jgi:hypothetical protein
VTELRCYWVASDKPRVLAQRHEDDCPDEGCRGCLPCTMDHCRVCGIEHTSGACGGCLTEIRDNLTAIGRMCAALPEEVEHRGVEGEAMALLAPVADPEAWEHVTASMMAGRIPADWRLLPEDWITTATDENHPLLVLGHWEMIYRDAFEHETSSLVGVATAAAYLIRHLTEAALEPWVAFEAMAKAVRDSCAYVERVLHDGEQVDRTRVTCTAENCRKKPRLVRKYGWSTTADKWECPSCDLIYEDGQFREAHARQLRHEGAMKFLPLRDAVATLVAQGRPERTIRQWFTECRVEAYCELGTRRAMVWWPDLWRLHLTTPTRRRAAA